MRNLKRALVLSGLTSMLAALAFAVPAQASGVKGVCLTQGFALASVNVVGGTGNYTFNNLAFVCVGLEKASNVGVLQLDVESRGTFNNIVCGTGTAKSTANVLNNVTVLASLAPVKTNWAAVVANLGYVIDFVALQGYLLWTSSGKPVALPKPLDDLDLLTTDGNLGGFVEITPNPGAGTPALPVECTKGFGVVAALVVNDGWGV